MSTEQNTTEVNEVRKVCSYKIYTQDGKFTEMASGKITLLIDYGGGSDGRTPITGLGMTMEGSSETDQVLIPSGFESSRGGVIMHVRLKGNGTAVNSIVGTLTRPLYRSTRLILSGEYRYVGGPFKDVLPPPPNNPHDFDYYFILLREDDADGLEDTAPISSYFDEKL